MKLTTRSVNCNVGRPAVHTDVSEEHYVLPTSAGLILEEYFLHI